MTPMPQPLSCQPQFDRPQPLQSSMLTSAAAVVPLRQMAVPLESIALSNCTNTESFAQLLLSARPRAHSRYGLPASASKVISKKLIGLARAVESFAAPAFACRSFFDPAAVVSGSTAHAPLT